VPNTPRTLIPYPSENSDPFFDQFVGMVEAVDSAVYAEREDRQTLLTGGGSIAFTINLSTLKGRLSWDGNIRIPAPITGFYWYIAPGYVDLLDGNAFYVTVPRAPTQNTAVLALTASQVPSSDADLMVGIRSGVQFYFRNGRSIKDGEVANVLENSSSASNIKGFKVPCRVATLANVNLVSPPSTLDALTLDVGDRVLVWMQSTPAENGIYEVRTLAPNTWARSTDFNDSSTVTSGSLVTIESGTYQHKLFELATDPPIVVDVTPLYFVIVGSSLSTISPVTIQAGDTGASGSSDLATREDHRHPVSTGVVGNIQPVTSAAVAAGTLLSLARSDHKHALRVDFAQAGSVIGSRPVLNFVSGVTLVDVPGTPGRVDATVSTFGSSGQTFRSQIPIALNQTTSLGAPQVAGDYTFDPGEYALTGTTVSTKFKICAFVVGTPGMTGRVQLWDFTTSTMITELSCASVTPSQQVAVVVLAAAAHVYEVRILVFSGTGSIFCQWAGIEVLNVL